MLKLGNITSINTERHSSSWFKVLGDTVYVVENNLLFSIQEDKKLVETYADTNLEITKSSNSLLVGSKLIGYDRISLDHSVNNEPMLKGFKLPFDSNSELIYFFRRDRESKEYRSGIFDTNSSSFILDMDSILNINFIEGDVLLNIEFTRIDKNGNAVWKFIPNKFEAVEIQKTIGVYQNQLLVSCSNHLLLSIDVATGKVLHHWQELEGFEVGSLYKDVLPDPTNFVLDKSAAKLIGVFDTYYFEIDLESKEISYHQLKDELAKHGIRSFRPFSQNPYTPDHLFLTAHTFLSEVPNVDLSSVLALNRNTKKVDWVYIFKDTGLGTNVPQITSTHLYQLDLDHNLHIFERTN